MKNSSHVAETSSFKIYKFGNCYLNTGERKVFRDKEQLEIVAKAFDILQLLIERQGEVVTKDEILENVWEDSFVEEGNLTVYVSKLRRMLNADKSEPFIETVSGLGYRFVSLVSEIDENEFNTHVSNGNNHSVGAASSANSIAVLPLKNENGDEEIEYLTDGITESIINSLSYLPNLRVIARNTVFRFKGQDVEFQRVGKELDVQNILTGRIRIIRNKLMIGVELINANDGTQIWGTQINQPFEDIFEVQEEITKTISQNLKSQIGEKTQDLSHTQQTHNPESYRLYLKGKYLLNKKSINDIKKAIELFHQSISAEPTNAESYIALSNCYFLFYQYEIISYEEALNKSKSFLAIAKQLNPENSEIYSNLSILKMSLEFDYTEAERLLKHALSLNPNSLHAHYRYADLLIYLGKFPQAMNIIQEIIKIDPLSPESNKKLFTYFYATEQYQGAVIRLKECLELNNTDFEALLLLGATYVELKQYKEALEALEKSLEIQYHSETLAMIGYTKARSGKKTEAKQIIKQLLDQKLVKKSQVSPTYLAIIYSGLGEIDRTFEFLEKSFNKHFPNIGGIKVDPRFKPIRQNPRFNELLRKIGLPTD